MPEGKLGREVDNKKKKVKNVMKSTVLFGKHIPLTPRIKRLVSNHKELLVWRAIKPSRVFNEGEIVL